MIEARKGLAGAREAVTNGTASLQAGDTAKAASATRLALEGVTGATGLLDAIDRLAASLTAAEQQLPGALREAETDLADARETTTETGLEPGSPIAARLSEAERALAAARAAAAASPADPAAALSMATEAQRLVDEVLAAAREKVAARQRLEAAATASIRTAASAVDRAADLSGRGGGVSGAGPERASRKPNATSPTLKPSGEPILRSPPRRPIAPSGSPMRRINSPTTTSTTGTRAGPVGASDVVAAVAAMWPARSWAASSAGSCRAAAPAAEAGAVPHGVAPGGAVVVGSPAGAEAVASAPAGSVAVAVGAAADAPGAGDGEAWSAGPTGLMLGRGVAPTLERTM